jgi:hypothetical protein
MLQRIKRTFSFTNTLLVIVASCSMYWPVAAAADGQFNDPAWGDWQHGPAVYHRNRLTDSEIANLIGVAAEYFAITPMLADEREESGPFPTPDLNEKDFRDTAIDWIKERSLILGVTSDLLVSGSDTGFHIDIDPGDKYALEWTKRF